MSKTWIFKAIKELNELCDKLNQLEAGSKEYDELNLVVGDIYDTLIPSCRDNYTLHYSKRTGHYYVRF